MSAFLVANIPGSKSHTVESPFISLLERSHICGGNLLSAELSMWVVLGKNFHKIFSAVAKQLVLPVTLND